MTLEKDIEKAFNDMIKASGGISYKFTSPGNTGVPDRLIALPSGRLVLVELKRPVGGKLSAMQIYQRKRLKKLDIDVIVIKNKEDIEKFRVSHIS